MSSRTQQFTITDPRDYDGDPFEVAERAVRQSAALASLLSQSLKGARLMARNAEMERQLFATSECSAAEFEASPQARRLDAVAKASEDAERSLTMLAQAAGYNPRKPPRISG